MTSALWEQISILGSNNAGTIALSIALKGTCLLALATVLAASLRRASAATRHLLWSATLAVLLVLPALTVVAPELAWLPAAPVTPDDGPETSVTSHAKADTLPARRPEDTTHAAGAPPTPIAASPESPPADEGPGELVQAALDARTGEAHAASQPLVLFAWLAGAMAVVAILLAERINLFRLARGATPAGNRLAEINEHDAVLAGVRPAPQLLLRNGATMPMTWGFFRSRILLPADAAAWPGSRIHIVLRHELAHIRRRDHLVQSLGTLATALHWFNPLAWYALHRLRIERELACDDEAVGTGLQASHYAHELLEVARRYRALRGTALVAEAMAHHRQLSGRLLAVLETSRRRSKLTPRRAMAAAVMALSVGILMGGLTPDSAVATPTTSSATTAPEQRGSIAESGTVGVAMNSEASPQTGTPVSECWAPGVKRDMMLNMSDDSADRFYQWESRGCFARLEVVGEFRFDASFEAITDISRGGYLRLRHRENGQTRELEIRPGSDSVLEYELRTDGGAPQRGEPGRAWWSTMLAPIMRATGWEAEGRAAAIYARSGAEGVFREVELISGNTSRSLYLSTLLRQTGVATRDQVRALDIAREIDSNSARSRVAITLIETRKDAILNGATAEGFWRLADAIDSNSSLSRILRALMDGESADSPYVDRALVEAQQRIDSNSQLAGLLEDVSTAHRDAVISGRLQDRYWETVAHIDSNSTLSSLLLKLVNGARLEDPVVLRTLEAAHARIDSNSTLSNFLLALEQRYPRLPFATPTQHEYWASVRSINSGSTLSSLLLELTAGKPDDSPMLPLALSAARDGISSSSTQGKFLISFATGHPGAARGALREDLIEAARSISSRSVRERTVTALHAAIGGD